MSTPSGISGKRFVPAFVIAIAGTIATFLFLFLDGKELRGDVIVDIPLSATDVAGVEGVEEGDRLVIRRGFDQRRELFMVLIRGEAGGDEREVWSDRRLLYTLQDGTRPLIAHGLITVRTRRSSNLRETHAFRLVDASFVWNGMTPSPPFDGLGAPGPTYERDGVLTEVYEGDADHDAEVIGARHADGVELYRVRLPWGEGAGVEHQGELLRYAPPLSARANLPRCFSQRTGEPRDCP